MQSGGNFFGQTCWFELLNKHVFSLQSNRQSGYLVGMNEDGFAEIICPCQYVVKHRLLRSFNSLTCFYTPLFKLVTASNGVSNQQIIEFFSSLALQQPVWHRFVMHAMAKEDAQLIAETLNASGFDAVKYYCFANWFLPVTYANFDDYLQQRPSIVMNTVRRKSLAFEKLSGSKVTIYSQAAELDQAAKDYAEVYAASWKQNEAYPEFMSDLFRLTAGQEGLRLAIAYIGEEPVASQFWIVADQTAYIYKLAYKEQYKALGIGTVLTAMMMKHVMEIDQVKLVDYLTGDDAYKRDWMTHRRERWGVVAFNTSTLIGRIQYYLECIKNSLKGSFREKQLEAD